MHQEHQGKFRSGKKMKRKKLLVKMASQVQVVSGNVIAVIETFLTRIIKTNQKTSKTHGCFK